MKSIVVRSLSGFVYVALIIASLLWGGEWAYPLVCALLAAFGVLEINHLSFGGQPKTKAERTVLAIDIIGAAALFTAIGCSCAYTSAFTIASGILGGIAFLYFLARAIVQLYIPIDNPIKSLLTSYGGYLYIVCPLLASAGILVAFNAGMLLTIFLMIWSNDTGAYLAGISMGRHKLCERISPKKTWEGFIGGMLLCTAAVIASYYLLDGPFRIGISSVLPSKGLELWQIIVIGITVSIVATWGDLVESLLKRAAHVKDSGHVIPGHGGILDRIDSLLLVMPWMLFLLILMY